MRNKRHDQILQITFSGESTQATKTVKQDRQGLKTWWTSGGFTGTGFILLMYCCNTVDGLSDRWIDYRWKIYEEIAPVISEETVGTNLPLYSVMVQDEPGIFSPVSWCAAACSCAIPGLKPMTTLDQYTAPECSAWIFGLPDLTHPSPLFLCLRSFLHSFNCFPEKTFESCVACSTRVGLNTKWRLF